MICRPGKIIGKGLCLCDICAWKESGRLLWSSRLDTNLVLLEEPHMKGKQNGSRRKKGGRCGAWDDGGGDGRIL